ncbi:MAG: SMC-Scp complex subunit ScpB [Clostridia bacterium]|nr:SMC-Scp complex subunit ScpB [Clostridia bacterium]
MLKNMIEALIFAAAKGVTYKTIKEAFGNDYTEKEIKSALKAIEEEYAEEKGIVLIRYNDTYQFQTNPKYGEKLADILRPIKERQLSQTVLQTLSIIAYRQPITRAEIEDVRNGVSSDYAISVLLKAELIDVVGRKEALGRPLLYGTTDTFLKRFKLHDLSELPDYDKLMESVKNSDKYNKNTENLYRITDDENPDDGGDSVPADGDGQVFFDQMSDEMPSFLEGEDILFVE